MKLVSLTIAPLAAGILATLTPAWAGEEERELIAAAIEARACLLTEDETVDVIRATGLQLSEFSPEVFAMMQDGVLVYQSDGTHKLVGWGDCAAE